MSITRLATYIIISVVIKEKCERERREDNGNINFNLYTMKMKIRLILILHALQSSLSLSHLFSDE